jgi:predicted ATP-grasp superfamily ATP-dependent carboligase
LAGVDFAHLAWRQALGENVTPCHGRPGVAWMHGQGDLKAAFHELRGGTLTLRDYFAGFRQPMTFATFALDDPMPALMELPAALWHRLVARQPANDSGRGLTRSWLRTAK